MEIPLLEPHSPLAVQGSCDIEPCKLSIRPGEVFAFLVTPWEQGCGHVCIETTGALRNAFLEYFTVFPNFKSRCILRDETTDLSGFQAWFQACYHHLLQEGTTVVSTSASFRWKLHQKSAQEHYYFFGIAVHDGFRRLVCMEVQVPMRYRPDASYAPFSWMIAAICHKYAPSRNVSIRKELHGYLPPQATQSFLDWRFLCDKVLPFLSDVHEVTLESPHTLAQTYLNESILTKVFQCITIHAPSSYHDLLLQAVRLAWRAPSLDSIGLIGHTYNTFFFHSFRQVWQDIENAFATLTGNAITCPGSPAMWRHVRRSLGMAVDVPKPERFIINCMMDTDAIYQHTWLQHRDLLRTLSCISVVIKMYYYIEIKYIAVEIIGRHASHDAEMQGVVHDSASFLQTQRLILADIVSILAAMETLWVQAAVIRDCPPHQYDFAMHTNLTTDVRHVTSDYVHATDALVF
jgi:hypothetical protein